MTRIFLHTVSNQYNAYNLILRLMAWEIASIPNTTEDNTKLQIFSLISQRQRIQSNFMNHTYQTSKQTNKQTQPKLPKQRHQRGFYHWHKVYALTTATTQILEYSCSGFAINQSISYISSITNLYPSSMPKNLYVAWWTISCTSSIPTWIRYQIIIRVPNHMFL